MGAEVDAQRVLSSCFAASSLLTQSAVLSKGTDRIILASVDLESHMALTFSSGIRPNAGSVNRGSNTANNTKARNIRPPCNRPDQENLLVGIAVPAL